LEASGVVYAAASEENPEVRTIQISSLQYIKIDEKIK
jgi:hypothetical protein